MLLKNKMMEEIINETKEQKKCFHLFQKLSKKFVKCAICDVTNECLACYNESHKKWNNFVKRKNLCLCKKRVIVCKQCEREDCLGECY